MLHALQKESECSFLSFTGSRFQLSIEKVASYSALTMGFHFFENMSKIELQCLLNFEFPLQSVWKISSGREISANNCLKSLDRLSVSISLPNLPVFLGVSSRIAVLAYPQLNLRGIGVNVATVLILCRLN